MVDVEIKCPLFARTHTCLLEAFTLLVNCIVYGALVSATSNVRQVPPLQFSSLVLCTETDKLSAGQRYVSCIEVGADRWQQIRSNESEVGVRCAVFRGISLLKYCSNMLMVW